MSAAPLRSPARTAPSAYEAPRRAAQSPILRAVPAPAHGRSVAPFAWMVLAVVVAALGAVLVLNTATAEDAYQAKTVRVEIANLHQERATALTQLESNAAPAALAQAAQALGMVPASRLGFIRLEDGAVLGQAATQ